MALKRLIGRENYLDLLDKNTNSFRKGIAKNIALLGSRKCGKTSILREHIKNVKDIVPVYMDLGRISLNPENFSIEFIGNVIFHILKKPVKDYKRLLSLQGLLEAETELNSKDAFSFIKSVEGELLKIKPDQKLIVESAFKFVESWAGQNSKKVTLYLDNFENLLDLNNFSQIRDILSIVNFNSENVNYVAASSAVRESLHLLKKFECHEIKNLEKKECVELIKGIIGNNEKACNEIFQLSSGHPFIAVQISKRFNEAKDAKKAFIIELLQKENPVYDHCNEVLNYHYNRARGQTLLRTILKIIAEQELRLSEIAKRVYRSAPVTKSILERLIAVDVIYKKDNRFYFTDNVLRLWINLVSQGFEFDDVPDEKTMREIEGRL